MTRIVEFGRLLAAIAFLALPLLAAKPALAQSNIQDDRVRTQIAPRLQHLRNLANQRQQVRVIAQFKATGSGSRTAQLDNSRRALRSLLGQRRIQALSEFSEFPLAVYSVSATDLDALIDSGLVEHVQEDGLNYPTLASAIPYIKGNVPRSFGYTGSGATVGILDTGVDSTHPALAGRVVAEACYSTTYAPQSATSLCPGGAASSTGAGSGAPCASAVSTGCQHGTHVASIAAGANASAPGVAPAAKVIAVQVFSRSTDTTICAGATSCVVAYDSDVIKGLTYIYNQRNVAAIKTIAAVNMSLGGGQYTTNCDSLSYKAPIDTLRAAGIATVIASGNNGYSAAVNAPGCVSTAITVGSVNDANGTISSFSNSLVGFLDLMAPGDSITAAAPGGGYITMSGTSMATPFVTGAFALLKSLDTTATVNDMETRLKTNSTPVADSRNGGSFPRLNLDLVTESLVGSNHRPTLVINSPANNAKLAYDKRPFALSATASDVQDGNLSNSVTWRSNKDGLTGWNPNLTLGAHTLTASVADSNGFSRSLSINVSVLNAPTVAITAPATGLQRLSSQPFVFSATATDIESGNLGAAITWSSNISGALGSGATLNKLLAPGAHVITANVLDGDGMPASTPPTITVTSIADTNSNGIADTWESLYSVSDPNADPDHDGLTNLQEYNLGTHPTDAAPKVTIAAPAAGANYAVGASILFIGVASDAEDGSLGSKIKWSSNLAGPLGTGPSITRTLAAGTHIISATVVDSKGASPIAIPTRQITVSAVARNGDIDGNGTVDVADALLLQQYLAGTRSLTSIQTMRGDIYPVSAGDGQLTLSDLLLLEKLLAH